MIVLREKYSIPTLQMRKPSLRSCSEHIVMDHTVHKTLLSCEEFILCSLGLGLQSTLGQREEHVTQTWPIRAPHPLGQWLTHKWTLTQNGPIRTFPGNFLRENMIFVSWGLVRLSVGLGFLYWYYSPYRTNLSEHGEKDIIWVPRFNHV